MPPGSLCGPTIDKDGMGGKRREKSLLDRAAGKRRATRPNDGERPCGT